MDTKLKGDIAEHEVILSALKNGWGVAKMIGDRLPYDLVFDVNNKLVRIQVKSAWLDDKSNNYVIDTRKTNTNSKSTTRSYYNDNDFDFAIIYIDTLKVFYIMPISVFLSYKSLISFVEDKKRQRFPKSFEFRENWEQILLWAA